MADLDKETIKKLTQLSRIGCPDEEQEAILHDLKNILAYIEQLQELDTEDVPPCNNVIANMKNVMRKDVPNNSLPRKEFLENSPEQIGGMIRVPEVIKKK